MHCPSSCVRQWKKRNRHRSGVIRCEMQPRTNKGLLGEPSAQDSLQRARRSFSIASLPPLVLPPPCALPPPFVLSSHYSAYPIASREFNASSSLPPLHCLFTAITCSLSFLLASLPPLVLSPPCALPPPFVLSSHYSSHPTSSREFNASSSLPPLHCLFTAITCSLSLLLPSYILLPTRYTCTVLAAVSGNGRSAIAIGSANVTQQWKGPADGAGGWREMDGGLSEPGNGSGVAISKCMQSLCTHIWEALCFPVSMHLSPLNRPLQFLLCDDGKPLHTRTAIWYAAF
jgi:hypothetical protein